MFYPRILTSLCLLAAAWSAIPVAPATDDSSFKPGDSAPISSKVSLVHLGSIDSFTITEQGTLAGRVLLNALEKQGSGGGGEGQGRLPRDHSKRTLRRRVHRSGVVLRLPVGHATTIGEPNLPIVFITVFSISLPRTTTQISRNISAESTN